LLKKSQNIIQNNFAILLIFLTQLAFCFIIVWQQPQFWYIILFLVVSWLYLPPILAHNQKWWILLICSFLGLYVTLFLKNYCNTILAASIGTLLMQFIPKIPNYGKAIFYAGAFAAMGDFVILNALSTAIIPFVCATFAWFTQNIHNGIGGKLGTIGFLGATIHFVVEFVI
jgi:hypothetical protein